MNDKIDLARVIKQQRAMMGLTLEELSDASGVSPSHLGRIERGERFPSARILSKIAKPLGTSEVQLFASAGYMREKPSVGSEALLGGLDPYVAKVLEQEPVEVQRTVIAILTILKSLTKGNSCDIGFAEYARRKYPELDEDVITMIEDLIKRQGQKKGRS